MDPRVHITIQGRSSQENDYNRALSATTNTWTRDNDKTCIKKNRASSHSIISYRYAVHEVSGSVARDAPQGAQHFRTVAGELLEGVLKEQRGGAGLEAPRLGEVFDLVGPQVRLQHFAVLGVQGDLPPHITQEMKKLFGRG